VNVMAWPPFALEDGQVATRKKRVYALYAYCLLPGSFMPGG